MLWGDELPATWEKALRVLTTKLRALLGECGIDGSTALTSAFGCYKLTLPPGAWIDVDAAADALERAEAALVAGDLEAARGSASTAAALSRRSFLPGEDGAWVEEKRRELRDVLVRSLECLRDAAAAAGEFAEAARHAEEAVELEPFRETGYRRLMEIHAAAGNPAEALRVYERCRRFLADELGAYPSAETDALYRDVLRLDRGPESHAAAAVSAPPSPPPRGAAAHAGWRDRRAAAIALAVAVLAAAVTTWRVLDGEDAARLHGDSIMALDGDGTFTSPLAVGRAPSRIAAAEGAVWVGSSSTRTVKRVDPDRGGVVQTITLPGGVDGLTAAAGSVWATSAEAGVLARISPETNTVVQTLQVPNGPRGVAFGEGAIWVVSLHARTLTRVEPVGGRVVWTRVIGGSPQGVAVGRGAVWVSNESGGSVTRVDPRSGRAIHTVGVGNGPGPIMVGAGAVWVANTLDGTVSRIDPATSTVAATIRVGEGPAALAVSGGQVWVASEFAGTVTQIDPTSNSVVRTVETGQRPVALTPEGGRLWVAARDAARAHRGGTLRVGDLDVDSKIDQTDYSVAWMLNLTGDGLTAYRRADGAEGARLVPDLAVSMPSVGDGGTTYTFQLRRGIRYSNGETVGPADIRRAIERYYRLGPAAQTYYDAIVGTAACRRRPATCDLSRGIVADRAANTITFQLSRPDANLLYALALPFAHALAPSAPKTEVTGRGLPATGPYVLASSRSGELRFVRNPRFRVWSSLARPDGYADEIVVTQTDQRDGVKAIEEGRLDTHLFAQLPPPLLERLSVRYPDRLRIDPMAGTLVVTLNTSKPPFDRIEARRALAYALDRRELIRLAGGSRYAEVACQILPPNFPAHEPYCPFTRDPAGDGRWRGPDLEAATRLVARSGTAGARVVVRSWDEFGPEAEHVAAQLRALGYRATARVSDSEQWFEDAYGAADSPSVVQVGLTGWLSDYPAPSTFFEQLRCAATDPARFCDRRIEEMMDAALARQVNDPAAADALWQRLDRELTDQAAWIAYATPRQVRFVGERVGNYQYHPVWWTLLDQLWVR